ncbi:hypothetical protein ACS72_00395 [Acinetobacter sp. VT 511]|nr:hypothetical protein ACS72_00395 [Acinetobacter sp. VT 511]
MAAGHRRLVARAGDRIAPDDGSLGDMALLDRHLHHHARFRMDRQERRIGGAALLAERRQHDRLDRVEALERGQQRLVEGAGPCQTLRHPFENWLLSRYIWIGRTDSTADAAIRH